MIVHKDIALAALMLFCVAAPVRAQRLVDAAIARELLVAGANVNAHNEFGLAAL